MRRGRFDGIVGAAKAGVLVMVSDKDLLRHPGFVRGPVLASSDFDGSGGITFKVVEEVRTGALI